MRNKKDFLPGVAAGDEAVTASELSHLTVYPVTAAVLAVVGAGLKATDTVSPLTELSVTTGAPADMILFEEISSQTPLYVAIKALYCTKTEYFQVISSHYCVIGYISYSYTYQEQSWVQGLQLSPPLERVAVVVVAVEVVAVPVEQMHQQSQR